MFFFFLSQSSRQGHSVEPFPAIVESCAQTTDGFNVYGICCSHFFFSLWPRYYIVVVYFAVVDTAKTVLLQLVTRKSGTIYLLSCIFF